MLSKQNNAVGQKDTKNNLELEKLQPSVVLPHFPGYFLIGALLLALVLMFFLIRPFFVILVLAGVLAASFYSLYNRILIAFKNRASLASLTTCILILVVIVIPMIFFLFALSGQALDTVGFINQKIDSGQFDQFFKWQKGNLVYDLIDPIQSQLGNFVDIQSLDLKKNLIDLAKNISTFLVAESASILKGVGGFIWGFLLNFFLLIFALYYFFKDGEAIKKALIRVSPLPIKYDLELFKKFREMSEISLVSIFLVSILKGIIGGIGFIIVGIPNPLFWGTAMAVFSLIPIVGPAIIWLPAAIILLLNNNYVGGGFLLIWGVLLVSTIDNIFQAYFVGGRTNLNPLLVFLAVFGGIGLFGLVGIIFGPLILTLFLTLLHIYQLEYRGVLKK